MTMETEPAESTRVAETKPAESTRVAETKPAESTRAAETKPAESTRAAERTLFICKPDAVERRLVGQLLARLEAKGLRVARAELRQIDEATAKEHYAEHEGKAFFDDLVAFITRSPAMLTVIEGPEGTIATVRTLMGVTDPQQAAPGTIRGDLAIELTENLVHGSDSPASAEREIGLFFPA